MTPPQNHLERFLSQVETLLKALPQPLWEPLWYPGELPERINLADLLQRLGELLRACLEIVLQALAQEGFFEENPLIRVYPNYPQASGLIVFYKGKKVFEKWINTFELNLKDKQAIAKETATWYEEMYNRLQDMSPQPQAYWEEEIPPWERRP